MTAQKSGAVRPRPWLIVFAYVLVGCGEVDAGDSARGATGADAPPTSEGIEAEGLIINGKIVPVGFDATTSTEPDAKGTGVSLSNFGTVLRADVSPDASAELAVVLDGRTIPIRTLADAKSAGSKVRSGFTEGDMGVELWYEAEGTTATFRFASFVGWDSYTDGLGTNESQWTQFPIRTVMITPLRSAPVTRTPEAVREWDGTFNGFTAALAFSLRVLTPEIKFSIEDPMKQPMTQVDCSGTLPNDVSARFTGRIRLTCTTGPSQLSPYLSYRSADDVWVLTPNEDAPVVLQRTAAIPKM